MTAAETAVPPVSTRRTADASIVARTSAAESETLLRVRGAAAGVVPVGACWRRLRLRLRCRKFDSVSVEDLPLLLPLLWSALELELELATARWIKVEALLLSFVALELELGLGLGLPLPTARWTMMVAALLLSFAAQSLTAWIWVRFFWHHWGFGWSWRQSCEASGFGLGGDVDIYQTQPWKSCRTCCRKSLRLCTATRTFDLELDRVTFRLYGSDLCDWGALGDMS